MIRLGEILLSWVGVISDLEELTVILWFPYFKFQTRMKKKINVW